MTAMTIAKNRTARRNQRRQPAPVEDFFGREAVLPLVFLAVLAAFRLEANAFKVPG
ncbi:hypothetical protein [Oricola sp.]|uniref:hypothetical protein n=1 Tax=Oricola sp. TaxID=1979950 RepID=UPI0025DFCC63|nr:hypothetical protein [Oricola sp.]MCI5077508.1 hypothetical protein [Oricola sp.]